MLVNLWKENFRLMESANGQRAWAKIKLSVDTAGPAKSIRQCKDKIRNLKDTYIQTKGNNKKSGSAPQTSVYFDNFDQVLGTRDGISSKNITQAGFEEELLLSDWDKNEPPENNFGNETSSSSQQNMENKSGNNTSSCTGRNLKT